MSDIERRAKEIWLSTQDERTTLTWEEMRQYAIEEGEAGGVYTFMREEALEAAQERRTHSDQTVHKVLMGTCKRAETKAPERDEHDYSCPVCGEYGHRGCVEQALADDAQLLEQVLHALESVTPYADRTGVIGLTYPTAKVMGAIKAIKERLA